MISRTQLWFLCLVAALTPVFAAGQVTSPSPAAQTSKSGKITGRVVNEKGQPLPYARVSLRGLGSMGQGQSIVADQDGRFEVSGLDRMTYQIAAWLSAYAPQPRHPSDTQSSNVRVGDSVTLVLMKGGVITGAVTNHLGEPVVGVRVRAKLIRDGELLPAPYAQMSQERTTDDRGVYRIYGLPAGTYVVWAGGSGMYPVANPFDADVPTYAPGSTRDEAAEITVHGGEEINVDIRYRGEPGRVVSGTVSGPAPDQQGGIGVELTSVKDNGVVLSSMRGAFAQQGAGFSFQGVDDGDYYITARTFLPSQDWALSTSKRIQVRGADVTGIELVTQPLGSISGRVVLEESSATECTDKTRPLFSEMLISAWHRETEATKQLPRFVWSLGAPLSPDAEGNVRLRNIAPGDYRFVAQFSGKYWYLQSVSFPPPRTQPAKPVDASRTWTAIKSGERLSGLTITLAQGAASLRGQVALAEGETVPEKLVAYLVPAEREKADDALRYFAVAVTPDGKIAFNNLAPGRYLILAQTAPDDRSPSTKLRLPDSTEMRSTLRRAAEVAKTEVEFKPCQNMTDFRLRL